MGLTIFIPLSCSCGSGVASSCPCWSPRGTTAESLLGAFSELISHFTPLSSPSHPSAWLHSCLSGSSCLCAVRRLFFSYLSIFSLSVEAAGYEEPLPLFCSPELDFLGHISDLKLSVGERIGHAGYLDFLPRKHTFPGIFC